MNFSEAALALSLLAPVSGGDKRVWIAYDPADLPVVAAMSDDSEPGLLQVKESQLVEVSQHMHESLGRCSGFFAFDTKEEALAKPRPVASQEYTLDQQAWTAPLMSRVQEKSLRATIETLAAYHNRYYASDTGLEAARWIQGRWASLAAGIPGASAQLVTHSWKQPSVVLTIPGSERPEEVVVLGGHLDSIAGFFLKNGARAPGADDNASGIAVLTEALRVLAESGFRPKRTVQFMGYAAEEIGLRGSQAIAKDYAAAGRKVVGVVQFDMTNFKGSGDQVFLLSDYVDPALTAFLGRLLDAYVGARWSTTKCGYACSDHASWTRSGFPASAAFESSSQDMNKKIHTDGDTLAHMGGTAAHSVPFAKLAAAFAAELGKQTPPAATSAGR